MGNGMAPSSGDMNATPPAEQPPAPQGPPIERPTKGTTNVFTQVVGVSVADVDDKIRTAVNRYFGIGTNESTTPVANTGYRVYYELPQDNSMAFIWAADTNDVRSEGMSYGMMIAVQMDMQPQFDRLWKFAKTYMQFSANAQQTSWRNCFRWQGTVNTGNANNWQVNFPDSAGPAPDGDQYFAAALYLANRRWGSGGATNYKQEASNISHAMISNPSANNNTPLFNTGSNLPVFYPNVQNAFSDPSYNLPAFYEIFALDGQPGDSARWRQIEGAARSFFVSSANPTTGLHPDYANFNGTPNAAGSNHDQFVYDAWRVVMNMAVDYSWFSQDARLRTQVDKYHAFFANHLKNDNVDNSIFALNGGNASGGSSTALTSTLGAGALASDAPNKADFVNAAWNVYQQSGQYRYYQESVYLLGLLATGGVYGYEWAQQ
jgi:oligosaccharide reducing-end xylanase